jgi:hypothetical protein
MSILSLLLQYKKMQKTFIELKTDSATLIVELKDNNPVFDNVTEPTLSILLAAYETGNYKIISDTEPIIEPPISNWNAFNIFMLSDATFNNYCNVVFEVNKNLNSALLDAYALIATNGVDAFVNIWNVWCGIAQITNEHRNAFANTAESLNLPSDFVSAIRGQ